MTSDPAAAAAFIERHGHGRTIYKIFSATQQVWRETRLVTVDDLAHLEALRLAPVIIQVYIPAAADVRVTVVGVQVFAMAIDSRGTSYEVDFRVSLAEARTSATTLPEDDASLLRELMARLELVYGAIDLRLTPSGEYVFLEVNPAGEFLFAEAGTGLPITDAVAGWLAAPS
jgi:glutathione synthase/RimK-type ligase-like ATP-grasp enzyme